MTTGLRRVLDILGDGACTGSVVGFAYGAWAVQLNHDLAHRVFVLAFRRVADGVLAGGVGGAIVSALLAALLATCARRGSRALRWGAASLVVMVVVVAYAVLVPLRDRVLPLHVFSPRSSTVTTAAVLLASLTVLVTVRIAAAARVTRSSGTRAGSGSFAATMLVAVLAARLVVGVAVRPGNGAYSVLVVSLDTLRADRVGTLGARRDLTPGIDRLAREGVLFTAAESPAPWTLPAHVSLFTSRLPWDHRVQALGTRIPPQHDMLAERFLDAGYRTGAFTAGGYLDRWYGFGQGFESFAAFPDHDAIETERIVAAALDWIARAPALPFFAFVHTYATHVPYRHPELADPRDAGRLAHEFSWANLEAIRRGELLLTASERRYVTDLYDGGVAYADRALGRLFEELRRRGILDHTIVVVLSDHGEELWDHGSARCPDHGHSLYEELTHVPLVIRAPGLIAAGARVDRPVSLLDVAPTLLDLAGLPAPASYAGVDLAASCRGAEPPVRPIVSESTSVGPDRWAVRLGNLKAIVAPRPGVVDTVPAPSLELFDLGADAGEMQPLPTDVRHPQSAVVAMAEERAGRSTSAPVEQMAAAPLPDRLSERLRALGYAR